MIRRRPALALALAPLLLTLLAVPAAAVQDVPSTTSRGVTQGDTLDLRDAWWAQHRPRVRTAPRTVTARPTTPQADLGYPADNDVVRTCSDRVCVHHVTSGRHASTQAWADRTLQHLERSWTRLVDELRFRAPAADGDRGGDQRFDVYLADTSARGQYGFCHPEDLVPGQTHRATTYCVLDNDMASLPGDPATNLGVTAAHEFFHAVQFNTDVAEDRWFMEATATWAERQVFPGITANRGFLADGQLGNPTQPLDSTPGMYGNWLFVHWLEQRYGTASVRDVWHRLDATTGRANEWSVQGVSRYVRARGHSWPNAYRDFALANAVPVLHRGVSGLSRLPPKHPDARLALRRAARGQRTALRLDHLTARTVVVRTKRRPGRPRVRVTLRTSRPRHVRGALVLQRRDGRRVVRALTPGPKGRVTVRYRHAKVKRAVIVVANTSLTYRDCLGSSGWACGGQPVHDNTRVLLRARLVR